MPLNDFIKDFGLDPDFISRDLEMSEGLARGHEKTAQEYPDTDGHQPFFHWIAAATEYRRAGAHSILLSDRKRSREMFGRAARLYSVSRRPYALMMQWCSDDTLGSDQRLEWGEGVERTQLAYLLVTAAATQFEQKWFAHLREELRASQNSPVGVLGIPVGAYLDLADVIGQSEFSESLLTEALLPFLLPYSLAIRRCMSDEYHWERLAFPFHPAEPDTLSVVYCVEATLRRKERTSIRRLLENMPLGRIATAIINYAIAERFRDGRNESRER